MKAQPVPVSLPQHRTLTGGKSLKHFLSGCSGLPNNIAVVGEGNEGNHCPLQQGTYMKEFMHSAQGLVSYDSI